MSPQITNPAGMLSGTEVLMLRIEGPRPAVNRTSSRSPEQRGAATDQHHPADRIHLQVTGTGRHTAPSRTHRPRNRHGCELRTTRVAVLTRYSA